MASRHQPVDPFGSTTDPAALVTRPAVTRVLEGVQVSLLVGKRRLAITGPDGIGKTLILHALTSRLEGSFESVYLPYASLPGRDLCAWILTLRDEPIERDPVIALEAIARRYAADERPLLVVIDDASSLLDDSVRLLGSLIERCEGALRVVVAPTDDFRSGRLLAAFGEGLEEHRIDQPMTFEETRAYLEGRLAWANVPSEMREVFTPDVVSSLHRAAAGLPGPMNALASRVLRGDPRVLEELAALASPSPQPPLPNITPLQDVPEDAATEPRLSSVARELRDDLDEDDFPVLRDDEAPSDPPSLADDTPMAAPVASAEVAPVDATPELSKFSQESAREPTEPIREFSAFSEEDAEEVDDEVLDLEDDVEAWQPSAEAEEFEPLPWQERISERRSWAPRVSRLRATVAAAVLVIALLFVAVPHLRQLILESPAIVQIEDFANTEGDFGEVAAEERFSEPAFGVPVDANREPAEAEEQERIAEEIAAIESGGGALVGVNINADPWAHVEVDGVYVGLTPLADVKLTPGAHRIRARLPGGEVIERSINVDAGNRHIALAPGQGD
ncbi:MAG: AAA family ATPase [Myxococcales bacterium]|nr:AAA family ATPase [Myxococcales bacterium]